MGGTNGGTERDGDGPSMFAFSSSWDSSGLSCSEIPSAMLAKCAMEAYEKHQSAASQHLKFDYAWVPSPE